jgi:hypothetical protein
MRLTHDSETSNRVATSQVPSSASHAASTSRRNPFEYITSVLLLVPSSLKLPEWRYSYRRVVLQSLLHCMQNALGGLAEVLKVIELRNYRPTA